MTGPSYAAHLLRAFSSVGIKLGTAEDSRRKKADSVEIIEFE